MPEPRRGPSDWSRELAPAQSSHVGPSSAVGRSLNVESSLPSESSFVLETQPAVVPPGAFVSPPTSPLPPHQQTPALADSALSPRGAALPPDPFFAGGIPGLFGIASRSFSTGEEDIL